jgi:hypothetical protein
MTVEPDNTAYGDAPARRVLVIGGTGVFGRRLVRHLAQFDGLALTITSRRAEVARALATTITAQGVRSTVTGLALEREQGLDAMLATLKPWLVIDASGPFQGLGYDVPQAALKAGAHVIDLADARDYLSGYATALDDKARACGRVALAGASSTPTLSGAAVAALVKGWRRVDTIGISITPGGKSEVGHAVITAILGYAGRPVPVWREGRLGKGFGWIDQTTVTVPGLGPRRVALVETADAEVLGPQFQVRSKMTFMAGLESRTEQIGLVVLARMRRRGWLGALTPLVPALLAARRVTGWWTSDRGGMVVKVSGLDVAGRLRSVQWSLLAINGDGPVVPILPAAAAVRALLRGTVAPGARLAADALNLADIEAEMVGHAITTARDETNMDGSIFAEAVGAAALQVLPAPVQAFHRAESPAVWTGAADIEAGRGLLARLIGRLIGLPTSGRDVPVVVSVERVGRRDGRAPDEIWTRNFGGKRLTSRLSIGPRGGLTERFGSISFRLMLDARREGLVWSLTGWRCCGVPMPRWLAPRSDAREFASDDGRFRFDVRVTVPLVGDLVHYCGWLKPSE